MLLLVCFLIIRKRASDLYGFLKVNNTVEFFNSDSMSGISAEKDYTI